MERFAEFDLINAVPPSHLTAQKTSGRSAPLNFLRGIVVSTWTSNMTVLNKIILLYLSFRICSAKSCYFPNGQLAGQDTPCYSSSNVSFCCGPGSACLSNKVCINTLNLADYISTKSRGSCTDRSWISNNCPKYCDRGRYHLHQNENILHCFQIDLD